jgi:mRNA-degrading endonuclease toxin of MazEF toxin-antitoxin module
MRRGEVWWGAPTLPGGSRKRRPFLVVSHDGFNRNERYPKVLAVHVTTVRRAGGPFAWEVAVPAGAAGLSKPGVVKCGEVYTLFKHQLSEVCGTLGREAMGEVDRALAVALCLPR